MKGLSEFHKEKYLTIVQAMNDSLKRTVASALKLQFEIEWVDGPHSKWFDRYIARHWKRSNPQRTQYLPAIQTMNRSLRQITALAHKLQFELEWIDGPNPEWFDHFIDQHWKWANTRNPMSWERGFFSTLAMSMNCTVLDLCCGDGFYSHHWYSSRAREVIAVDFDPAAITHARANFESPNVRYLCADIRNDMPTGDFTNVVWDGAIEHFTQAEMLGVMNAIKARLTKSKGVLSGYTIVSRPDGDSLEHHEYEFTSRDELADFLHGFFENVSVIQTLSRDEIEVRDNLYFYASDGPIPFGATWENLTMRRRESQ
jgi:SAM-dependent methyltransferase